MESGTWCIAGTGMAFCPGRTDRMGAGTRSRTGLLVWRAGVLSRTLDRWRLRPMLDTDADRERMELRSIVVRDHNSARDRFSRRSAQPSQSAAQLDAAYGPTVGRSGLDRAQGGQPV